VDQQCIVAFAVVQHFDNVYLAGNINTVALLAVQA
jgi:hypothetical protein